MDSLTRNLSQFFGYFCVATLLSLGMGLGYLWSTGKITGDKAFKILAIVHDVEFIDPNAAQKEAEREASQEPSYAEVEKLRQIRLRDLELKLDALNKDLEELRWRRGQLTEEKARYEAIKTGFTTSLAELSGDSTREGFANVRRLWETIPPKLVKQQMMAMVDAEEIDDVVIILADMPDAKKGKIVQQFTADDEVKVMDQILRKIRQGLPAKPVIDKALEEIQPGQPATP